MVSEQLSCLMLLYSPNNFTKSFHTHITTMMWQPYDNKPGLLLISRTCYWKQYRWYCHLWVFFAAACYNDNTLCTASTAATHCGDASFCIETTNKMPCTPTSPSACTCKCTVGPTPGTGGAVVTLLGTAGPVNLFAMRQTFIFSTYKSFQPVPGSGIVRLCARDG
jgi:hypothetical protein